MATLVTPSERRSGVLADTGRWSGPRSVLSLIGNTPLIRLDRIGREFPQVEFLAKAEWANPGGSVKDRTALSIIADAEQTGRLNKSKILLDATSGNTGIAYAMICAIRGYRLILTVPANASMERKRVLSAYGAEVIYTDSLQGTDGALRVARNLYRENPALYFYADQYNNPANWKAHYHTTGVEIFEQTHGRVTHFIAGLGTSGTFMGTTRRLKELSPGVRCISVQPDSARHGLEGLKHMASAIVPGIYDPSLADRALAVGTEEAHAMACRLAHEEGLLVGISAAAAMVAALRVASEIKRGVIVMIFPDSGNRYLSESFWDARGCRGKDAAG